MFPKQPEQQPAEIVETKKENPIDILKRQLEELKQEFQKEGLTGDIKTLGKIETELDALPTEWAECLRRVNEFTQTHEKREARLEELFNYQLPENLQIEPQNIGNPPRLLPNDQILVSFRTSEDENKVPVYIGRTQFQGCDQTQIGDLKAIQREGTRALSHRFSKEAEVLFLQKFGLIEAS